MVRLLLLGTMFLDAIYNVRINFDGFDYVQHEYLHEFQHIFIIIIANWYLYDDVSVSVGVSPYDAMLSKNWSDHIISLTISKYVCVFFSAILY